MANASIYNAFERFWGHTSDKIADVNVHIDETMDVKLKSAKNHVDGMYDITHGDTVTLTQLATDTEEDYVHATLKNADRDWYGYPPKISNAIPTLEDFANGANYHFAFNPNIASLDISISSDEVKSYNGCLNIRNLFAVITEEYVGVDMMNVDGCTIFEDIVWNDTSVEKITFPEAGIYCISNSEAVYFVWVEGIPVETIQSAESATVSLTIPNYTGFETSKTLKPEHLTEHDHSDLYHTKDVTNAKVSGVKNYVDGMYDITYGSDTAKRTLYGFSNLSNESDVTSPDAYIDWDSLDFTPGVSYKISDATPTYEELSQGATIQISSSLRADAVYSVTLPDGDRYGGARFSNGCSCLNNFLVVITEEYAGIDLAQTDMKISLFGSDSEEDYNDDLNAAYFLKKAIYPEAGTYVDLIAFFGFLLALGAGEDGVLGSEDDTDDLGDVTISITIPNYTGFVSTQTLKSQHIPDTIATKEYVDAAISAAIG